MSSNRGIQEINRHTKNNSVLVITSNGVLKRIYCPFKVVLLQNINAMQQGEIKLVEAVKMDRNLVLVYVVEGIAYHYYFFKITN